MKYNATINRIETVNEIPAYWTNEDYANLLVLFEFPDASDIKKENLLEYLKMAITDMEPSEAAAILLHYKLGDRLNEGQIQQISNDMLIDKVCEEYPEIDLHAPLFHINQMLFLAYNGKFLNASATILECEIQTEDENNTETLNKEQVLKTLAFGLSDSALLKRLFSEQLAQEQVFEEANSILWDLEKTNANTYKITTSEYWLSKADFNTGEFQARLTEVKE